MANYKETAGAGLTWRRANQVIINNPLQAETPKSIRFGEEDVVLIEGKTFQANAGSISITYDPDALINLRDPATGEKSGTSVKQSIVYQALYSLYLDAAEARDIGLTDLPPQIDLNYQGLT